MEGIANIVSNSPKGLKTESHMNGILSQELAAGMELKMETSMERDGTSSLSMKRDRDRLRKYSAYGTAASDGSLIYPSSPPDMPIKRSRGRPRGSGKKKIDSFDGLEANSTGQNFLPHIITIGVGEDVVNKISSFALKGPRSICILSANGAISNATIRQLGSCSSTTTYEGRFEILSLSGSFTFAASGRIGGLSISLAGPDGCVFGGLVAGLLTAASPIQLVVGSFLMISPSELRKMRIIEPEITFEVPISSFYPMAAAGVISEMPPEDKIFVAPTSSALMEQNRGETANATDNDQHLSPSSMHASGWLGSQIVSE